MRAAPLLEFIRRAVLDPPAAEIGHVDVFGFRRQPAAAHPEGRERDDRETVEEAGIAFLPWYPLSAGSSTGCRKVRFERWK